MKERMMMKTLGVWCLVVLITVAPGCAGWSQPSAEQQAQITELRKLIDSGVSETQAAFAKYKLGQLTAVDLSAVVEAVVQKTQDANAKILALQSSGVSPWQSLLNVLVPIAASLGGALLLDKSVKTAAVTESTQRVRAERGPARVRFGYVSDRSVPARDDPNQPPPIGYTPPGPPGYTPPITPPGVS